VLKQVRALDFADAKLADQILRASKSVCLNIAEAVGRFGDADRRRVYAMPAESAARLPPQSTSRW
jgi:four helix bundle protein